MNRFNQTVRVMVGITFLTVTSLRAAELSAEDKADVATLTKFIEGPSISFESNGKDFSLVVERRSSQSEALLKYTTDQCLPWQRSVGPCGDETILLSAFYLGSLLRDEIRKTSDDSLYRAWLVVVDRYRLFCDEMKKVGEPYAGISALEEMIRQDKAGTLKARASAIEARLLSATGQTLAEGEKK